MEEQLKALIPTQINYLRILLDLLNYFCTNFVFNLVEIVITLSIVKFQK